MRTSVVLASILAGLVASKASATLITATGADLLNSPGVAFPNGTPALDANSIIFGPGGNQHEKLLVIPLLPAGALSAAASTSISIAINLTRLQCTGSCLGSGDSDPHILLGDGTNLVGAVIADNGGGEFLGTALADSGDTATTRSLASIFTGAGYPAIGDSFDVNVEFDLIAGSTTVAAAFLGGSGVYTETSRALDPTAALEFVFMRNNDVGEQYQINSLSIELPRPVAAPPTLFLIVLGLTLLLLRRSLVPLAILGGMNDLGGRRRLL